MPFGLVGPDDFYEHLVEGEDLAVSLPARWLMARGLLPKDPRKYADGCRRTEPIWIEGVGQIASAMLSDLSPEFYQVCLRSTGSGQGPFRALPICGRWGWRRRARLAGLL